jgi:hypothetical protein
MWWAIFLRIKRIRHDKEIISQLLTDHQNINVIQSVGDWDLEITFFARDVDEADHFLMGLRDKFGDDILDHQAIILKDRRKQPQVAEGIFGDKIKRK